MPPYEKALLVNLIGHAAGTLIFATFLALFLRDRVGSRLRGSWLTVLAAALALLWNAASLVGLLTSASDHHDHSLLATISFIALSLLPAVLLHISLRDTLKPLRLLAYLLSAIAAILHTSEFTLQQPDLHSLGLLLITIGFGILTVLSAAIAIFQGRTARGSRLLGSMSLAIFAMSFAHFGAHDGNAWSNELFFHHAGLPLAVFVLLQDFRFLLVDAFLRFVASAALAGAVVALTLRVPLPATGESEALGHSLTLGLYTTAMLVFAGLHSLVQDWLTHAVFRRPDAAQAAAKLRAEGPTDDEDAYLDWSVRQLAGFLNAGQAEAAESADACGNPAPHPVTDHETHAHHHPEWVEAVVPIEAAKRVLLLGRRAGGRRYLSEDYGFLGQMAAVISERLTEFRTREMQRLVGEAELRALQSQINPHFLFNALNTIYGTIPRASAEARQMVRNLSDIFRYSLQQTGAAPVPLEREMAIVRAYLEIEQLRFGARLKTEIDIDPDLARHPIPPLTIQPVVENAIKHAIAANPEGGTVRIQVSKSTAGVKIQVTDTGRASAATSEEPPGNAIGLQNVRRRLELHYNGSAATLTTDFQPQGSLVTLRIP